MNGDRQLASDDGLGLDPANANKGTERGRALVEASLQECGAGRSILADRDGTIIAGNKTLEAARKLGLPVRIIDSAGEELVVVRRSDLKLGADERARRLAYLDNRAGEVGLDWDIEQLLGDLEAGIDLGGVFSEEELAVLLAVNPPASPGLTDPDEVSEPPEAPVSGPGVLWEMGGHRLLCGDSTKADDVARVMGGERASLMATDGPFGVSYDGGNHPQTWSRDGKAITSEDKTKHWDDYQEVGSLLAFYEQFLKVAREHALSEAPIIYQWFAMTKADVVMAAWRVCGLLPHQVIVWHKSRSVLGRSDFMYDYEPCMYGWVQGKRPEPERRPPANATAVWQISSAIEDGVSGIHPTQKVCELIRRPIEWHTRPGELIYEPFCGSGTAIIAAEMTGRRCYAIEQSPAFVDAAVARWERFTGRQAQRG